MLADGLAPGPVFCLLLRVSSDYAQLITGQVTEVTCPVTGWAQPELTPSKRQKTDPLIGGAWPAASTVLNTKWCNFFNLLCFLITLYDARLHYSKFSITSGVMWRVRNPCLCGEAISTGTYHSDCQSQYLPVILTRDITQIPYWLFH